jgi:hypothetical protein
MEILQESLDPNELRLRISGSREWASLVFPGQAAHAVGTIPGVHFSTLSGCPIVWKHHPADVALRSVSSERMLTTTQRIGTVSGT